VKAGRMRWVILLCVPTILAVALGETGGLYELTRCTIDGGRELYEVS